MFLSQYNVGVIDSPQHHRIALPGYIVGRTPVQYRLFLGLDDAHIDFLVHTAHFDPLIISQTHDQKRFSSRETVEEWLTKERIIYSLSPAHTPEIQPIKPNNLAGIAWFSQKKTPETPFQWTFAVRLYESARGNGLSFPFMKRCFEEFWKLHPGEGVWLVTNSSNLLAQKLYEKFGFHRQEALPDQNSTVDPNFENKNRIFYVIRPTKTPTK